MKIQIHRYEFELQTPYEAGRVIDASEAKVLNILRSERIRNSASKFLHNLVKDLDPEELLSDEALAKFREKVRHLDETFVFVTKDAPKAKKGTFEAEVRVVAEEHLREDMRREGRDEEELDEEVMAFLMASQPIQEEAKLRLAAKKQVAEEALAELLA